MTTLPYSQKITPILSSNVILVFPVLKLHTNEVLQLICLWPVSFGSKLYLAFHSFCYV